VYEDGKTGDDWTFATWEGKAKAEEWMKSPEQRIASLEAERDALKLRMRAALNQCDTAINSAMQGNPGEYVASITNDNRNLLVENAALKAQLAAAQATIAALQWTPITMDNLPLKDSEVIGREGLVETVRYHSDLLRQSFAYSRMVGWTHFRPISPPAQARAAEAEQQPAGAKQ
jgi:hypothetical protein